ncbi:TolC family protein [Oligoflexus tunisiensis]|uniref:TolC family protein n=1 Tax=Oligoflexus tunisiensis TaxID=708132 RepID=UPI000A9774DC|nr:TolC family protein [Oligoflexus tunisiensis]
MQVYQIIVILIFSVIFGADIAFSSVWEYWEKILHNHPEIRSIRLEEDGVEESFGVDQSALFPRISTHINYFDQTSEYSELSATDRGILSSIRVEQVLFDLGLWHRLQAVRMTREWDYRRLQGRRDALRLAVLLTYWRAVLLADQQIHYRKVFHPLTDRLKQQGQMALDSELRTRDHALQWDLSISQIELQAQQVEVNLAELVNQLKTWAALDDLRLCLRKPEFIPSKGWIDSLQAEPHRDDFDVALAVLKEKRLQSALNEAQAEYWPRISAFAEWQSFKGTSQTYAIDSQGSTSLVEPRAGELRTVGLSLNWTIFEGWRSSYATHLASTRLAIAEMELMKVRQNQKLVEKDIGQKLALFLKRFEHARRLKEYARKNLSAVMEEHRNGLKSFDASLAPMSQFHEAHQIYYRSLHDFFSLLWTHWNAIGRLDDKAIQTLFDFCGQHDLTEQKNAIP